MIYLIIALIAFFLFDLSLCVAAGRADEAADRCERELLAQRLVPQKQKSNAAGRAGSILPLPPLL